MEATTPPSNVTTPSEKILLLKSNRQTLEKTGLENGSGIFAPTAITDVQWEYKGVLHTLSRAPCIVRIGCIPVRKYDGI